MKSSEKGFTLIEVMITVAIIGILASIALPSYREYVLRSNRAEGQAFLSDVAARQERYYAQNNAYTAEAKKLGYSSDKPNSETGKYRLSINTDTGYALTATPTFDDPKCTQFTLNSKGEKGASGTGGKEGCWR